MIMLAAINLEVSTSKVHLQISNETPNNSKLKYIPISFGPFNHIYTQGFLGLNHFSLQIFQFSAIVLNYTIQKSLYLDI